MIALPEYSQFVPNGDMDALENCVNRWLSAKSELLSKQMAKAAKDVYAKEAMVRQYEELYGRMICSKSN